MANLKSYFGTIGPDVTGIPAGSDPFSDLGPDILPKPGMEQPNLPGLEHGGGLAPPPDVNPRPWKGYIPPSPVGIGSPPEGAPTPLAPEPVPVPMPDTNTMIPGTFTPPGAPSAAIAPFRTPNFTQDTGPGRFGPGTPIESGGEPTLEEILRRLKAGGGGAGGSPVG